MRKLFFGVVPFVVIFIVGALVGIFAQPYFPSEMTDWIADQRTRVDSVVEAVNAAWRAKCAHVVEELKEIPGLRVELDPRKHHAES